MWDFFEKKGLLTNDCCELDINKLRKDLTDESVDIKVFRDIFIGGFDPQLHNEE